MLKNVSLIKDLILKYGTTEEWKWIDDQLTKNPIHGFVTTPRRIQKMILPSFEMAVSKSDLPLLANTWSLHRLVRVWFLLHINQERTQYIDQINELINTAEINEAVAIYSSLSVLPFAEDLKYFGTEAVRSNIGQVFDAFAFGNPYAAIYFSEAEWNQLVLKTIFNEKPIHLIIGLKRRSNKSLALAISDFAHERWAAGRTVPAQVWRLTIGYIDDILLQDIHHLIQSEARTDQMAAYLICTESDHPEATSLLKKHPILQSFSDKALLWDSLEEM